MAFVSLRANKGFIYRLNDLIKLQRLTLAFSIREVFLAPIYPAMCFHSVGRQDASNSDMPKWNKIDGRAVGISRSMVPSSSLMVLKVLRSKGFEAYLVGGCVRDLILNRVPKDFDVITTAGLKQIRTSFHRAQIVGRRFPICLVKTKGSVIEVSSFDTNTVAKNSHGKETAASSQIPRKCDKMDIVRWRNSINRDFTINSLFFDPFLNVIYDYTEGIADLRFMKLRTLIPASKSFKEDCARILRGLRIAARLGLTLSKDTETAMRKLSFSITSLDKSRLMMELNYMLSYGAAAPSLCLLQSYKLLEILLPFHAAYLYKQGVKTSSFHSTMLMKLFSNLDKLFSCDRPSDCNIWVALLAFHRALVNNPQNSHIVLAFAATLYHGDWIEAVNYARENSLVQFNFRPEITSSPQFKPEELAKGVTHFALKVQASIAALTSADCREAMSTKSASSNSSLTFLSKRMANDVAQTFEVLVDNVKFYKNKRENFEIDYQLLGKGVLSESRYVLGKIILETLKDAIVQGDGNILDMKQNLCVDATTEKKFNSPVPDLTKDQLVNINKKIRKLPSSSEVKWEANKKYKLVSKDGSISDKGVKDGRCIKMTEEEASEYHAESNLKEDPLLKSSKCRHLEVRESKNMQENLETMDIQVKIPSQELLRDVEVNPKKMDDGNREEGKIEKKDRCLPSQGKEDIKKKCGRVTDIKQHRCPLSLYKIFK